MNMRSAPRDFTARAAIRTAALQLFADHGPDAVTVRQIATAAGVSPALVVHHFGSKAGLRAAVDDHVASLLDELFESGSLDATVPDLVAGRAGSVAELMVRAMPPDSPVPGYLRRLLLDADPVGRRMFEGWFRATTGLFDQLARDGILDPGADPPVRAAFALVNDLAVILLRDSISAVLGIDPLSSDGMRRWADEVAAVYRFGLWSSGADNAARIAARTAPRMYDDPAATETAPTPDERR